MFLSWSSFAQNSSKFVIKDLPIGNVNMQQGCNVSDLIIFISSNIDGMTFESNLLKTDSFKQIRYPERDEYVICHSFEPFKLTINAPNYESVDLDIDGLKSRYKFKVTGALVRGTLSFNSKPQGATVEFLPDSYTYITPFTQSLASATYDARISKNGYKTIDTVAVFPIDETRDFYFELKPVFRSLKFDIQSIDSMEFKQAPVLWLDNDTIVLNGLVNKNAKLESFDNELIFNTVYSGNIIPIRSDYHQIKIEAPGFNTYEVPEKVRFEKGKTTLLKARLVPFYGQLNVIDEENSEGADVYLDGKNVGKIPLEYKVRIGTYKVRIEKPGYKTQNDFYEATVLKGQSLNLPVAMNLYRQVSFIVKPVRTKVWLEGAKDSLLGHTPFKAILLKGDHILRFEKSGGYATEKYSLKINEKSKDLDTIRYTLRNSIPLIINAESDSLDVEIRGLDSLKNIVINSKLKTPAQLAIPYGKYSVVLREGILKRYRGKINYSDLDEGKIKLPCYANNSFRPLIGDYNLKNGSYELTFGQSYFFGYTGLSTGILNAQILTFEDSETLQDYKTLIPNVFLLNWDFRLGGSIMRNLDICALGRFKYTPGLKVLEYNINGFTDATMITGFYGVELSSRFSYINFNCKAGMQFFNGTLNVFNSLTAKYDENLAVPVNTKIPVVSLGVTICGRIDRNNNMLRIWQQPPVNFPKMFNFLKKKLGKKQAE